MVCHGLQPGTPAISYKLIATPKSTVQEGKVTDGKGGSGRGRPTALSWAASRCVNGVPSNESLVTRHSMWASWRDQAEAVRILIQAGADTHAHDRIGMTALLWASQKAHTEVIRILREAGAREK